MPNAQYADRKEYFRQWNEQRYAMGLTRINVWVPERDAEKIKSRAAKLTKKYMKEIGHA
mgnify:CR=1 FL=1